MQELRERLRYCHHSNGGFPLDQNIYQAVENIHGRYYLPQSVIIMAAASVDGLGR